MGDQYLSLQGSEKSLGTPLVSSENAAPEDVFGREVREGIHQRVWLPTHEDEEGKENARVKAAIFFIHGYDSHVHTSYLDRFGKAVNKHGIILCGIDLPGHGKSIAGVRDLVAYEDFLDLEERYIRFTLTTVFSAIPNLRKGTPFFIAGESMGGGLSLLLALRFQNSPVSNHPFAGVFLIAPAIHNNVTPPAPITWCLRNVCLPCCPLRRMFGLPVLTPEMISRNPQVQEELRDDQYTSKMPFRLYSADSLLRMTFAVQASIPKMKFAMLIVHGDADPIIPISGSRMLIAESATPDRQKQLIEIPGGFHDALVECENSPNYDAILEYLNRQIQACISP